MTRKVLKPADDHFLIENRVEMLELILAVLADPEPSKIAVEMCRDFSRKAYDAGIDVIAYSERED